MHEIDDRNEELNIDSHTDISDTDSKVKEPEIEKPNGFNVKGITGLSPDADSFGVSSRKADRDFQSLNSVQEYASRIRAFIGLEDESSDAFAPEASPVVAGSEFDDQSGSISELDKNETDVTHDEKKNVYIARETEDRQGASSEIDLLLDDIGRVSTEKAPGDQTGTVSDNAENDNQFDYSSTESDDNGLNDQQSTVSEITKKLNDSSLDEIPEQISNDLDNKHNILSIVNENKSPLSFKGSNLEKIENHNTEDITYDYLIKNLDPGYLDDNNKCKLTISDKSIDYNINEHSSTCEKIENNLVKPDDEIDCLVLGNCLKMTDLDVKFIKPANHSIEEGNDLNDPRTILREELGINENPIKGITADVNMEEPGSHLIEASNVSSDDDHKIERGLNSDDFIDTAVGQVSSIENIRRLSSEIVSKVLDSAENQLKDILEESQKSTADISDIPTVGLLVKNDSPKIVNTRSQGTIPNNKPTKEINLKEVLSKTYDSRDFIEKIETEMNKYNPEYDVDPDTICGIGRFKPQWLQPWATARVYLVLYSIIGILSGSYYSYLISTISTLEKRFAFKSKVSGSIMMMDEISPLLLGTLVGYFGGRTHRPRMVAFGMFLSSVCCFVSALPYFIYGAATHLNTASTGTNATEFERCEMGPARAEECDSDDRPPTLAAILFLMLGSFLKGFGNLAYYAVGLSYMDDNCKKQNTPIYFAVAFSLRLLGPLVGFLMSSAFLKYHENPFDDPGFGPEDPRWIGGWWMGFVLQGCLLAIFTAPIALFPKRLPGHKVKEAESKQEETTGLLSNLGGMLAALKRLGKNPLFIFITLHTIMSVFGSFGHYIMLPKYMENQFRLSASRASLLSGPPGIAALIVSTLIGGYLIYRFKPNAKFLTGGMAVLETIGAIGFLLLMIPQCENIQVSNYGWDGEGLILDGNCNTNCSCSTMAFTPVCAPDGKTHYFSPCYAACQEKTNATFRNCSCVADSFDPEEHFVTEGFCHTEGCWSQALAYIITLPIISFIVSILRVAHTMILLRSIKTEDKSVALGTFETFISAFGFIPYPVVFGALIDSACLVWEKSCGKTGNCWFYDVDKFNYLLHGASSLFSGLSALCLCVVFCLSGRVNDLYEEDDIDGIEAKQKEVGQNRQEEAVEHSITKF